MTDDKTAARTRALVSAQCSRCDWAWNDRHVGRGRPTGTPLSRCRSAVVAHVTTKRHPVAMKLLTVHEFEP